MTIIHGQNQREVSARIRILGCDPPAQQPRSRPWKFISASLSACVLLGLGTLAAINHGEANYTAPLQSHAATSSQVTDLFQARLSVFAPDRALEEYSVGRTEVDVSRSDSLQGRTGGQSRQNGDRSPQISHRQGAPNVSPSAPDGVGGRNSVTKPGSMSSGSSDQHRGGIVPGPQAPPNATDPNAGSSEW